MNVVSLKKNGQTNICLVIQGIIDNNRRYEISTINELNKTATILFNLYLLIFMVQFIPFLKCKVN
jgi:hypothetical protein